jgi:HD superfamily phosphohydrolase
MYWQVYLHKTGLVAEQLLIRILKRAKELIKKGEHLEASNPFLYFLTNEISLKNFDTNTLQTFSQLDDFDIISAIKSWQDHEDFVLRNLCSMIINRTLLKIKIKDKKIENKKLQEHIQKLMKAHKISKLEAEYFVFEGEVSNQAYQKDTQKINILYKSGKVEDIFKATDQFDLKVLSKSVTKYYICYPKDRM